MSELEHGLAATVGGAIVGAAVAIKDVIAARKKGKSEDTLAVRQGRLYEHVLKLEQTLLETRQEMVTMRHDIDAKLERIGKDLDEVHRSRTRTDELLPLIREQLKELRDDMRQRGKSEP